MGELVLDKRYEPDYSGYRGTSYYGKIVFSTLRTGIPGLDDFLAWIAEGVVEVYVAAQGARMLEMKVFRDATFWGPIPTYAWELEFWFFFPAAQAAAIPAAVWTILELIAAALFLWAFAVAISKVQELVWGPPSERGAIPWIPVAILVAALGIAFTPVAVEYMRKR